MITYNHNDAHMTSICTLINKFRRQYWRYFNVGAAVGTEVAYFVVVRAFPKKGNFNGGMYLVVLKLLTGCLIQTY